jgi:hypothetical protein
VSGAPPNSELFIWLLKQYLARKNIEAPHYAICSSFLLLQPP